MTLPDWESSAAVTRASLDAVIIADAQGVVLEFNPAAEAMFGHARADAIGRTIGELIVPAHHRAAHEAGMLRYASGQPARVLGRRLELEALRADGTVFPVELSITEAETGGQKFFAASLRDLSERRAIEEERRASADFLQALVDDQTEIVIRSDADFRVIFCNEATGRFFGVPRSALIGQRFTPGTPLDVQERLQAELPFLTPESPVRRSVDRKIMPDGEERWLEWSNRALFDSEGRLSGHMSVARDITEQMLASRALAASEARFAAFAENSPVAMFLKDEDGRYVMLNGEAAKVIGRPHAEILGRTAREVGTPASADQTEAADRTLRATRQPLQTVGQLTAAGEPYHWAMVLRFPITAPDGKGLWIGGFAIDMTAQRATEQDLERSREALHQSEKLNAMGSLLAGVAHELNNPLAIVVAQATMMEEDAAEGPLGRRAEKIRRAAERCGRIVQTFLGLARRKPAERQLVNLNDMARAAVDLMAYPLRTAGIAVTLDLAADLPTVEGDPDMLNQVVLNLVVNAQQALEGCAGPRQIAIRTRAQPGLAVIDLGDSGPGVPAEIRHRIFEPFFSTKPQGVGTGVGLSFCHSVISAHQGRLELLGPAEAGLGLSGATFRVSLPVTMAAQAEAEAPVTEPAAPALSRALVVDDEPELAEVLAEMLGAGGYAVEIATSATQAQALIRQARFDVILSDLRMPDMDGPAFFGWLETDWPEQAHRVAFVTGDALGAAAADFLTRAGRPILEKPFSRAGVLRVAAQAQGAAG